MVEQDEIAYSIFSEMYENEDIGEYCSYGIRATDRLGNITAAVHDISTDQTLVEKMASLLQTFHLSDIHLAEFIDDYLNGRDD